LERNAAGFNLYASGWQLEQFEAPTQQRLGGQPLSVTTVKEVIPVEHPPRKLVPTPLTPAEAVPEGTVSSPTDVIGVESMPTSFCVLLDNGGIWYVSSADWYTPGRWLKVQRLHLRLSWLLLYAAFSQAPLDCWYIQLERTSARELFWLLQKEMKVIH